MQTTRYKGHTITRTRATISNNAGKTLGNIHTVDGPAYAIGVKNGAPLSFAEAKRRITTAIDTKAYNNHRRARIENLAAFLHADLASLRRGEHPDWDLEDLQNDAGEIPITLLGGLDTERGRLNIADMDIEFGDGCGLWLSIPLDIGAEDLFEHLIQMFDLNEECEIQNQE